jgi:hypothetical protein
MNGANERMKETMNELDAILNKLKGIESKVDRMVKGGANR